MYSINTHFYRQSILTLSIELKWSSSLQNSPMFTFNSHFYTWKVNGGKFRSALLLYWLFILEYSLMCIKHNLHCTFHQIAAQEKPNSCFPCHSDFWRPDHLHQHCAALELIFRPCPSRENGGRGMTNAILTLFKQFAPEKQSGALQCQKVFCFKELPSVPLFSPLFRKRKWHILNYRTSYQLQVTTGQLFKLQRT